MKARIRFCGLVFFLVFVTIAIRLFYWQVIRGSDLAARADSQYFDSLELPAKRGDILASDGSVLVGSVPNYLLYTYKPNLNSENKQIADNLTEILFDPQIETASVGAEKEIELSKKIFEQDLIDRLTRKSVWELLSKKVNLEQKEKIESWQEDGLGFQPSSVRFYPDASSSAHVFGLVGNDASGKEKGYFGLEGYYDRELSGVSGMLRQERDALGDPILVGSYKEIPPQAGRVLVTNVDRFVQKIVEDQLKLGMEKYGASAGEVVIMDPATGGVFASASYPNYDPADYQKYDPVVLKNPTVSESYEPGSTFKVLVMAAALDSGVVDSETDCDICDGPVRIGKYTIGTWDGKYRPGENMTETIVHSDNVGMVFVSQKLGKDFFVEYMKKFGIGSPTGIDLQEEVSPSLRDKWGEIDLATASFGQGIAVTTMQMLRAVGAIANGGELMTPRVVNEIKGEKGDMKIKPKPAGRVISKKAADEIKEMMIKAVIEGEAKFAAPKGYRIAGKTGTAQIPVSGHYDKDKTIASFIGFAPADNPKFVMIVKLREPTSSPWGSETAAPLWFNIAKKLLIYWGIGPDSQ